MANVNSGCFDINPGYFLSSLGVLCKLKALITQSKNATACHPSVTEGRKTIKVYLFQAINQLKTKNAPNIPSGSVRRIKNWEPPSRSNYISASHYWRKIIEKNYHHFNGIWKVWSTRYQDKKSISFHRVLILKVSNPGSWKCF
jgi:hypothetical protein